MNIRSAWPTVACMAVLALGASAQIKKTVTKTDRLDFGSGGTIVISGAPNGSIKVVGSIKNEIEIVAQIEVSAAKEADALSLASASGFLVDDSRVRVSVISVGGFNKFGVKKLPKEVKKEVLSAPLRIDYTITVPRYSDIEIDGGKGDISVSGVEGDFRVNSLEGNSVLDGAAANAVVSVGTGSLSLGYSPRWHGRMSDIRVGEGDLTVRFPSAFNVELDASVLKTGSIENLIPEIKPRDRKVPFTDRSMSAKYGLGGPPLRFLVGSGKIKFERLN